MSRQEIVALKLQMGINPSLRIEPGVLLAMWQQLNRECNRKRREGLKPAPDDQHSL